MKNIKVYPEDWKELQRIKIEGDYKTIAEVLAKVLSEIREYAESRR